MNYESVVLILGGSVFMHHSQEQIFYALIRSTLYIMKSHWYHIDFSLIVFSIKDNTD